MVPRSAHGSDGRAAIRGIRFWTVNWSGAMCSVSSLQFSGTATGAVVDFIQRARVADFPSEALTIAKRCIVDGLGVMLAGSTQDAGRILREHVQGTDPRTAATVFGHLPLVLVSGPGAAARNSTGTVLVSGMVIGTLFTLFVVPVFYLLIAAPHKAEPGEARAAGHA